MWAKRHKPVVLALALFFCAVPDGFPQRTKHTKHENEKGRTVWNYDGGVFFVTDGSLPNGACFRISGNMNSDDFFEGLKRIDSEQGTIFQRGTETVTKFPDAVTVSFAIRDFCPAPVPEAGKHPYMTQKMVDEMRLSIYWKHGVELRPVKDVKKVEARVDRIAPYAATLAADLPPRYEWSYELVVPSAGVPLTDSLALVFETENGRIAARVAARL